MHYRAPPGQRLEHRLCRSHPRTRWSRLSGHQPAGALPAVRPARRPLGLRRRRLGL